MRVLTYILLTIFSTLYCDAQLALVKFPDSSYFKETYLTPRSKTVATPSFYGILTIGQPYDSLDWESFYKKQPYYIVPDSISAIASPTSLTVLYDTSQKVECIAYRSLKKTKWQYFFSSKLKSTFRNADPYKVPVTGMPIYILNLTDSNITIRHPKYRLNIIQEALNDRNEWVEIESLPKPKEGSYIPQSEHTIKKGQYVLSVVPVYKGSIKAKLRLKVVSGAYIYYSNSYDGQINWTSMGK